MKKFIMCVAVLATMAAAAVKAQEYKYVSPITVEMVQYDLQALRDSSVNDDAYKTTLTALQKQLDQEKKDINAAMASAKQERKLYEAQMSFNKGRKKQVDTMKKNMQKSIDEYDTNLKGLKKQYDVIGKIDNTTCDAIRNQTRWVAKMEEDNKREKENCQRLLDEIEKNGEKDVNDNFTMLATFLNELSEKETLLKNLAAQNKTRIEIVKAEIKGLKK